MAHIVLILTILLTVGFLGSRAALQLRIPHSVFLVVLGVASGIFLRNHYAQLWLATESLNRLFPELVLYVLLPPLIFESAYGLDIALLRKDILHLSALAVVALVLSTCLIGVGLHVIFGLQFLACLTFGALISATDPVSVVALFKEVGAPKRLTNLIEGESLLHDGTAIVLFRTLLVATTTATLGSQLFFSGTLEFFYVAFGGVLIGGTFAVLIRLMIRITSHSGAAQLGLTITGAYITFIVADYVIGVSGVISTMILGLYLGSRSRLDLNRDAFEGMKHLWECLALVANVLVFFAVGLIVDTSILAQSIKYIPLTLTIVYLARAFSIAGTVPLVNRISGVQPISVPYQVALFWGGLRGGLALGLVLILPAEFPHRDIFVALAIAIVFSTLFLNALTTGQVLRLLKLDQLEPGDETLYQKTLQRVRESVIRPLVSAAQRGLISENVIQEGMSAKGYRWVQPGIQTQEKATEATEADDTFTVAASLFQERHNYELKLLDGTISKQAYKQLTNSVSHRLDILSRGGLVEIQSYPFHFDELNRTNRLSKFEFKRSMMERLSVKLECLLTMRFYLEQIQAEGTSAASKATNEAWISSLNPQLESFYKNYAHYAPPLQTLFVANRIRSHSNAMLRELLNSAIINRAVYSKASGEIDRTFREAEKNAELLLRPSPVYLLARVAWLKVLPRVALRTLAEIGSKRVLDPTEKLLIKGSNRRSLYVVVAGLLENGAAAGSPSKVDPTRFYFAGDVLGERSLLFGETWPETIVAAMTTEVFEIEHRRFERFLFDYPKASERILSKERLPGES